MSPRSEPQNALATIELCGGLTLHKLSEAQCIERILHALDHGQGGWVLTPNLDIARQIRRDPDLRQLLEQTDLRVADGMPLVWASRIAGNPLPERVAGSSLISSLSRAAARAGRSVFLLGGQPGTARDAAAVLEHRCPGLRVVGTHCPPFGFEQDEGCWQAMEQALVASRPDIVFVGLGFPKQERVIQRLRPVLTRAWWLGVGISFSFLCGRVRRAPRWIQICGLEWVHRLAQEPRRLGTRYLVHGLPFASVLAVDALRRRQTQKPPRSAG